MSIVNGLPAMGVLATRPLRENSAFMFRWVPWLFDMQYALIMKFAPTRWLAIKSISLLGRRGLMRLIRAHTPDVIVSTYPAVTAVLGELRRKGRLTVPTYSSITDLAGLHFWAHPGIDLHFITHPESTEEVEKIAGPGSVRWAKPPTSPVFFAPRSRVDARRALGLPIEGKVIAVSGGGWGVGDLIGATKAALETPDATVLCLCGHNDAVRARVAQRFAGDPRLRMMGFTDRMGDVLAASDVLIHSTAGLTVLEAIIRGCPVISYGFGVGHVRESNRALKRFGLAQVVTKQGELTAAIARALEHRPEPDDSFARRPATASMILANERHVRSLPAWRVRTARAITAGATVIVIGGWTFTAALAYSLVSDFAHTTPITAVATTRPEVGVLVDASQSQAKELASAAAANGMHVSFAVQNVSSMSALNVATYGDQTVPRLPDGGLVSWWHTRAELHRLLRALGIQHHFLYASNGPSLAQWLLAHGEGGRLVAGAIKLGGSNDDNVGRMRLHAGEVIELHVKNVPVALAELRRIWFELQVAHLRGVPVGRLISDAGVPL